MTTPNAPPVQKSRFGIMRFSPERYIVVEITGVYQEGPLTGAAFVHRRCAPLPKSVAHRVLAELLRAEGETCES